MTFQQKEVAALLFTARVFFSMFFFRLPRVKANIEIVRSFFRDSTSLNAKKGQLRENNIEALVIFAKKNPV